MMPPLFYFKSCTKIYHSVFLTEKASAKRPRIARTAVISVSEIHSAVISRSPNTTNGMNQFDEHRFFILAHSN